MRLDRLHPPRRGRALAPVFLAAALAAVVFPAVARAHATLVRAQPADSTVLAQAPRQVRLWLSEEISPSFSSVRVLDARGREVSLGGVRVEDGHVLVVTLPRSLGRGAYSVSWRVLSEDDVHLTDGSIVFGVGAGTVLRPVGNDSPTVRPEEAILKWHDFAFLAGILGGLLVARFVAPSWAARRRALRLAVVCCFLALGLGFALLALEVSTVSGEESVWSVLSRLLVDTRWGMLWIGRQAVLVVLAGALVLLARAGRSAVSPPLAGRVSSRWFLPAAALGLALVVLRSLAGHAAGLTRDGPLAVAADATHLLAACVWVGGIAAATIALLGADARTWRSVLKPFGVIAAASAGIVVATGLYSAGRQVPSLDALAGTVYGKALIAKSALVLGVLLLGAVNAVLLNPGLARPLARVLRRPRGWVPVSSRRLPLLVAAEACVGVAVFLTAALLSSAPPARNVAATDAQRLPTTRTHSAGDLLISLTTKPNRPGENVFTVLAASSRRPAPGKIIGVQLRFAPIGIQAATTSARLDEVEPGRYRTGGDFLDRPGKWRVAVVVERAGLPATSTRFDWEVAGRAPTSSVERKGSLEAPLTIAGALLLVAVLAGLAWAAFGGSASALPVRRRSPKAARPISRGRESAERAGLPRLREERS